VEIYFRVILLIVSSFGRAITHTLITLYREIPFSGARFFFNFD